ncbi:uncharacterized protein LOC110613298 [Manihot esculenta]|uniref:Uncharacterized protein n=3 Tax=Manihot esculenta TaxID=3983 RepID=A0ACB7HWM6_MANES|nr:uncharacterized protein LOC110613298 [Manihot esculenta]KAG8655210.1 hypothetical protein MANES_04G017300v8 [Manihot esculenta]KAG8655211.1 hypothetical protein MANES_04G017300v8 [Manihot esculenta]KAG8655212.1 hypothetical protein MANES_04G017300v8 [Manihot esculenta]
MGHHMITRSKKQMVTRSKKITKNPTPSKKSIPKATPRKGRKKSKIPSRNQPLLPTDIISEILSWLPVRCLIKCQRVCKEWFELMQEGNFIVKNMVRNREYNIHNRESYRENGEAFKLIYTFDGLIMEGNRDFNKFRIRNLALRRVFDLPTPPHKSEILIPLIPSLVHHGYYKVISAYSCKNETNQHGGFEILTLGRVEKPSWKALDTNFFRNFNRENDILWSMGIQGIAYFVRTSKDGSENYEVVSFEMENESFTSCDLARSSFADNSKACVLRWEDQLALAEISNNELQVLVLKDYKKGKWAEKKTVIPLKFLKKEPYMIMEDLEPYRAIDGVVWFRGSNYLAYNIADEEIVCHVSKRQARIFRQSLVTFKGMRPG